MVVGEKLRVWKACGRYVRIGRLYYPRWIEAAVPTAVEELAVLVHLPAKRASFREV
jgi:hypothetical protein